jgi:hypothetical protein
MCRYLVDVKKYCTWKEFEAYFTNPLNWSDREYNRVRRIGRTEAKNLKLKAEEARQGLFVIRKFASEVLEKNGVNKNENANFLQIDIQCQYVELLDKTQVWGKEELKMLDKLTDMSRGLALRVYNVSSSKFHQTCHYSDCIRNVGNIINYRCYAFESLNHQLIKIWMRSNKINFSKNGAIEMVYNQMYHWVHRSLAYDFQVLTQ